MTNGLIFCTSCGAQNKNQNGFCTVCGVALASANIPQAKKSPAVIPSAVTTPVSSAPPKVSKKTVASKQKKFTMVKNLALIVGAILLGFVGGVTTTSSNVLSGVFGERFGSYSSGYDAGETKVLELSACARGESCAVGDTGPGGGIVFYVSDTNFKSSGSDCENTCKYLEAAPYDAPVTLPWSAPVSSCYATGGTSGTDNCEINSIHQGLQQDGLRTASFAVGMGMSNTNLIYYRFTDTGGGDVSTYAAGYAWAFENNGKTDWYLPSNDELNFMCKWVLGNSETQTSCSGGVLNIGKGSAGFVADDYWSSSEFENTFAWIRFLGNGDPSNGEKNNTAYVRPVRAFG